MARLPTLQLELATKSRGSRNLSPFKFSNVLTGSENSGTLFPYVYWLLQSIQVRNSQVEEMCRRRCEGGMCVQAFHALSGDAMLPAHCCMHQPGSKLLEHWGIFLWRFHYVGIIGYFRYWCLTQSPAPLPTSEVRGSAKSSNPQSIMLWSFWWPAFSLKLYRNPSHQSFH